jgi:PRC-barrel domain
MATNHGDWVADGMDVYDLNGEKIGRVCEVYDAAEGGGSGGGGGYLRVPTGFLGLGTEHHIPFSAIAAVGGDQIRLRVAKEELDRLGYAESPTSMDELGADYQASEGASAAEGEPELRRDWERRYPQTPWDRAKDAARDAWESATGT